MQGFASSGFRRKCRQSSVWEPFHRGHLTEFPLVTASLPFPFISFPLQLGSVLELEGFNELKLSAPLVVFLPHCGLNTLGGWAGNLSIFCKNVSMEKCVPSAKIWLTRELWEHIKSALPCIKGDITMILLSFCWHLRKNDLFFFLN